MGIADACTYGRPCRCSECCMCMECFFPLNVKAKTIGPKGGTRRLIRYSCPCKKLDYSINFDRVPIDTLIDDGMCKYCNTKMKFVEDIGGKFTHVTFECENEHMHLNIMLDTLKNKSLDQKLVQ